MHTDSDSAKSNSKSTWPLSRVLFFLRERKREGVREFVGLGFEREDLLSFVGSGLNEDLLC